MANSSYLRKLILRQVFIGANGVPEKYISLHSGDPGEDGANELAGAARQQIVLEAIDNEEVGNRDVLQFDKLPAGTVSHFGIWDARDGGHFWTGGKLALGLIVSEGQSVRWAPGDIAIGID